MNGFLYWWLKLYVATCRRAIAEELARLGAHVWMCARTSEDLEKCLAEYASATWSGSIHGSVFAMSPW